MRELNSRFKIFFLFFFLIFGISSARLFELQVLEAKKYKKIDEKIHFKKEILFPKRGKIFFSDGKTLLAENRGVAEVCVAPREIKNINETAEFLSKLLNQKKEVILRKLQKRKKDPWIVLERSFPLEKIELSKKPPPGVHFIFHLSRFYPQNTIFSQGVGFVNKDGKAQYGLEKFYDKILKGKPGYRKGLVDAKGNFIFAKENEIKPPQDGADLVLTVDFQIQTFVEKILESAVKKYKARGGTIIVMNPQNGEILAMSSLPNFNPNEYSKEKDLKVFLNPAVQISFEPGSIFKPITMAGALNERVITPKTSYIDKGFVKIGSYTIKNAGNKVYGKKTMTEVLEYSINTGAVWAEEKLGNEKFKEYVKKFGFGKKTGIDFPGESRGDIQNIIKPLSREKKIEFANASFGQGIKATPIQIATAFSAIANQGKMPWPHLVKKIIYPDGREKVIEPKIIGNPISQETAIQLTGMLISVVDKGFGKKAKVKGYFIAGKTGTAQVPWSYLGVKKKGYSPETIHSFVGYAPAFNPKFLIFIKLDAPRGVRFSADSTAPLFREIAKYLFDYYRIPPEREEKEES